MNTVTVLVSFANMKSKVKRNISVFGKRYSEQGENKFSFVTLSTEEEALLDDYTHKAIHDIVSRLTPILHNYSEEDSQITFTITNSRWDVSELDTFKEAFENSVIDYCASSVVSDYFGMYFPNQSQHFLSRAQEIMGNIVRLCYHKAPPAASLSGYEAVGGTTSEK